MEANVGDLVVIREHTHGYPDNWLRGTEPSRFAKGAIGILLEIKPTEWFEDRVFYKVATHLGIITIYSKFTQVIK